MQQIPIVLQRHNAVTLTAHAQPLRNAEPQREQRKPKVEDTPRPSRALRWKVARTHAGSKDGTQTHHEFDVEVALPFGDQVANHLAVRNEAQLRGATEETRIKEGTARGESLRQIRRGSGRARWQRQTEGKQAEMGEQSCSPACGLDAWRTAEPSSHARLRPAAPEPNT